MCKILVLTNTEKIKNKKHVTEVIAKHLMLDQRDGFGYAMQGDNGIFGERTTKKSFETVIGKEDLIIKDDIFDQCSNLFGTPSPKLIGGAIFHGRTSTNNAGLLNTHPIVRNNWTLIHNGVVNNHGPTYEKLTQNDTEDLVHYLSTTGVKGIEEHITGYYAIGAFDPEGNLHVIKDATANLYACYNRTLRSHFFGTTESLIKAVAKELNWNIGPIEKVKDDIHLIYDRAGKLTLNQKITSRGYGYAESDWAERSLGFKLHEVRSYDNWEDYKVKSEETEKDFSKYVFFDWNHKEMSYKEFMTLDEVTKLDCFVYRPDGTLIEADEYLEEKIS